MARRQDGNQEHDIHQHHEQRQREQQQQQQQPVKPDHVPLPAERADHVMLPAERGDLGACGEGQLLLRMECASQTETRRLLGLLDVAFRLSVAGFAAYLALRWAALPGGERFFCTPAFSAANVAAASLLLPLAAAAAASVARSCRARGPPPARRLSPRRRRLLALYGSQLAACVAGLSCYLASNAVAAAAAPSCADAAPRAAVVWLAFARWTCWNTTFLLICVRAHSSAPLARQAAPPAPSQGGGGNSGGSGPQQQLVLDLPLSVHWPKLACWLLFEACHLALAVLETGGAAAAGEGGCRALADSCQAAACAPPPRVLALLSAELGVCLFYYALWVWLMLRSGRLLRRRPWQALRTAQILFRLERRLGIWAYSLVVVASVIFWFASLSDCSRAAFQYFGLPTTEMMWAAISIIGALMVKPDDPGGGRGSPGANARLQEFAWTEDELPKRMEERNDAGGGGGGLAGEPMFCYETAVKLFFWSCLCYEDYNAALASPPCGAVAVPEAEVEQVMKGLSLYGLTAHTVLYDEDRELKPPPTCIHARPPTSACRAGLRCAACGAPCAPLALRPPPACCPAPALLSLCSAQVMVAWSVDTVLVAFRGSTTAANWVADAMLWRVSHPGSQLKAQQQGGWRRPKIHAGFLRCWSGTGLDGRVLAVLSCLVERSLVDQRELKFLFTGHSLGGACATLAAFDLLKRHPRLGALRQVQVYTFGAPRVGNHAFARLYEQRVPSTWHVINDQDTVPRGGKFLSAYKRNGQRVIVNQAGDMVVRPVPLESSLLQTALGSNPLHHLLSSYQGALTAVALGQLDRLKGLPGGVDGLLSLIRSCPIIAESMYRYGDQRNLILWLGSRVLFTLRSRNPTAGLRRLAAEHALEATGGGRDQGPPGGGGGSARGGGERRAARRWHAARSQRAAASATADAAAEQRRQQQQQQQQQPPDLEMGLPPGKGQLGGGQADTAPPLPGLLGLWRSLSRHASARTPQQHDGPPLRRWATSQAGEPAGPAPAAGVPTAQPQQPPAARRPMGAPGAQGPYEQLARRKLQQAQQGAAAGRLGPLPGALEGMMGLLTGVQAAEGQPDAASLAAAGAARPVSPFAQAAALPAAEQPEQEPGPSHRAQGPGTARCAAAAPPRLASRRASGAPSQALAAERVPHERPGRLGRGASALLAELEHAQSAPQALLNPEAALQGAAGPGCATPPLEDLGRALLGTAGVTAAGNANAGTLADAGPNGGGGGRSLLRALLLLPRALAGRRRRRGAPLPSFLAAVGGIAGVEPVDQRHLISLNVRRLSLEPPLSCGLHGTAAAAALQTQVHPPPELRAGAEASASGAGAAAVG